MLADTSADELMEWAAYNAVEPIGPQRADLRAGIVASTIANANRKRGGKPFAPRDFMPYAEKGTSDAKEQVSILHQIVALGQRITNRGS